MPTKTRLPNKTQWALDDIREEIQSALKASRALEAAVVHNGSTQQMSHVMTIVRALAAIERIALLARQGVYEQRNGST